MENWIFSMKPLSISASTNLAGKNVRLHTPSARPHEITIYFTMSFPVREFFGPMTPKASQKFTKLKADRGL